MPGGASRALPARRTRLARPGAALRWNHHVGSRREGRGRGDSEQMGWRDRGRELLEDPAERARVAEVKLADALAVLDVQKAPGSGSLTNAEKFYFAKYKKFLAGQAVGAVCPAISSPPWLRRSRCPGAPTRNSAPDSLAPNRRPHPGPV